MLLIVFVLGVHSLENLFVEGGGEEEKLNGSRRLSDGLAREACSVCKLHSIITITSDWKVKTMEEADEEVRNPEDFNFNRITFPCVFHVSP